MESLEDNKKHLLLVNTGLVAEIRDTVAGLMTLGLGVVVFRDTVVRCTDRVHCTGVDNDQVHWLTALAYSLTRAATQCP